MSPQALHILIADDDAEDLELLEESLLNAKANAVLSIVKSGKAVLEFLKAAADDTLPSLIVLDYSMPELNGLQVLSIVSNDPRYETIPVVIFSTSDSPVHIKECKKNGAIEYFIKPKSISELNVIAEKLIALCN